MYPVLAPWAPISTESMPGGARVKIWGRSYEFTSAQPFPSRIKTNGRQILNSPMVVNATVDGRTAKWNPGMLHIDQHTESKALISQSTTSADGRLDLSGQIHVEYDGMIRIDWRLRPLTETRLDNLSVDIKVPPRYAKYFYTYTGRHYYPKDSAYAHVDQKDAGRSYRIGSLPKAGIVRGFTPVVWLGDEERGIEWFCESEMNWLNVDTDKAISITRSGGDVILRLQLVSTPTVLSPESGKILSYTFGLQATPVKPVEKDVWDYRTVSSPIYGRDYALLTEKMGDKLQIDYLKDAGVRTIAIMNWTDTLCYFQPTGHEQDLRNLVKACHERGIQVLVYFGNQLSELAPEWNAVGRKVEWRPQYRQQDHYPNQPLQWVNYVCLNSEWSDRLVDGIGKLMDDYGVDGVYLDGTATPMPCYNYLHGCGFRTSDGTVQKTYPIFATRDALRRIYTAVKTRKPDGQVSLHVAGGMMAIPSAAWGTSYWAGETLSEDVFPKDDRGLDLFRTEIMGRQWGIPSEFLHYSAFGTDFSGFNKALAYSLLHDIPVRPHGSAYTSYGDVQIVSQLWKLGDAFDRKGAEWLPYWNNAEYVTMAPKGTYASLYKHPRNGVLMVVSNLSGRDASMVARLSFSLLKLGHDAHAFDALDNAPVEMTDGTIRLDLPTLGWKVVWIK